MACDLYASNNPSPREHSELESFGQVRINERFPIPLLAAHKGFVFLKPSGKKYINYFIM